MMLFHVLNLCSVCCTEPMTLPRLSPVVGNPVLAGSCQSIQHPRCVSWGGSLHWFIFSILFSVLKRKLLVGIRENLEHHYEKIQTAAAQRANQRKAGLVNISIYPIDWLSN